MSHAQGDPVAAKELRVTDRTTIPEKLLNEKIMELLRAKPACKDARSVMLDPVGGSDPHDWTIYHFDPGNGDRYACKIALRAIEAELRPEFGMTGRS